MRLTTLITVGPCVAVFTFVCSAWAAFPDELVDIRRLVPATGVVDEHFSGASFDPRRIVRTTGLSNAGDVFAAHCCVENRERTIRWLRSTGYEPEDLGRGGTCDSTFGGAAPCVRVERLSLGLDLQQTLDKAVVSPELITAFEAELCEGKGACESPLLLSGKEMISVIEPGASWNLTYADEVSVLELLKEGEKVEMINAFTPDRPGATAIQPMGHTTSGGLVYGRWARDSWHAFRYDMNTNEFVDMGGGGAEGTNVKGEGQGGNNLGKGLFHTNGPPYGVIDDTGILFDFGGASYTVRDMSDNDVIVGTLGNAASISRPLGDNQWEDPVPLDRFPGVPPFAASNGTAISDTSGLITGTTFDFADFSLHGVVWDEPTLGILANFGSATTPQKINGAGTMIVGTSGFPPDLTPKLWVTEDNWQNFEEFDLNELLAGLPSAGAWQSLDSVFGVNDNGQIVGKGTLNKTFEVEVFLLDTMELGGGVIPGDVNNDGILDFIDITPFINAQSAEGDEEAFLLLTPNGCYLCADIDMDGAIDFIDITPFVNLLDSAAASAVPEPASATLLVLAAAMIARRRRN